MNMADKKLSKKTSTLVVGLLLLGTAGLATAAATDASETLLPMLQGKEIAYERGLSRNSVVLAVHVASFDGEARAPAQGAVVSIHHMPERQSTLQERDDGSNEPIVQKRTDENGRALFELRPGTYMVGVTYDGAAGRHSVQVDANTRLNVIFDEEGQAHFHSIQRTDAAGKGETVPLIVRAYQYSEDGRSPIEGAKVIVYKAVRGEDGEPAFEPYARNLTNAHGGAGFQVPIGAYKVQVTTPDGAIGEHRLKIDSATGLYALFDEDGDASFRVMTRDSQPPERSAERPGPGEKEPSERTVGAYEEKPMGKDVQTAKRTATLQAY